MEARGGIEPPIKVLQTLAFPLGYRAQLSIRLATNFVSLHHSKLWLRDFFHRAALLPALAL
jgi:hypothetical protein